MKNYLNAFSHLFLRTVSEEIMSSINMSMCVQLYPQIGIDSVLAAESAK